MGVTVKMSRATPPSRPQLARETQNFYPISRFDFYKHHFEKVLRIILILLKSNFYFLGLNTRYFQIEKVYKMPAETQMTAQACKTMEEELAKCLKENAENQVKPRDLIFCFIIGFV